MLATIPNSVIKHIVQDSTIQSKCKPFLTQGQEILHSTKAMLNQDLFVEY